MRYYYATSQNAPSSSKEKRKGGKKKKIARTGQDAKQQDSNLADGNANTTAIWKQFHSFFYKIKHTFYM